MIIADAFGWTLPNNRILADDYAKQGFQVYLPEFMVSCLLDTMDYDHNTSANPIHVGWYVTQRLAIFHAADWDDSRCRDS